MVRSRHADQSSRRRLPGRVRAVDREGRRAKVYGWTSTPGGQTTSFVGTLRGNTLTFYTGRFATDLTVAGTRMYGMRRGGGEGENTELGLDKVVVDKK